jgi:hypothetical protein
MKLAILSTALVGSTAAFPALLNLNGKDKLLDLSVIDLNVKTEQKNTFPDADPKNCPYNPNHVPAAPWNPKFPYRNAKNGLPLAATSSLTQMTRLTSSSPQALSIFADRKTSFPSRA